MLEIGESTIFWYSIGIPKLLPEKIDIDMEEMRDGQLLLQYQPSISLILIVSMPDGHLVSNGTETGLDLTLIMDPKRH